jgi:hypothetical protein
MWILHKTFLVGVTNYRGVQYPMEGPVELTVYLRTDTILD